MSRLGALGLCVALVGCGDDEAPARDQWALSISTDAEVPKLGDRLVVEIVDANGNIACPECRRVFGAGRADAWPVSFGVVPPEGDAEGLRVRARLYRSELTGPDGLPTGAAQLDRTAMLPKPRGVTRLVLELGMDCFGVLGDPLAALTCDPATGLLGAEPLLSPDGETARTPGSWPPFSTNPCPSSVPEGMVCIPGGVFLLGGDAFLNLVSPVDATPERLTRVETFALDADEMTVGELRQLILDGAVPSEPIVRSPDPFDFDFGCTYLGVGDDSADALPANCVSKDLAEAACAARGRRLPTEAEWEYAASNRGETRFPWGDQPDHCSRSIVGRGRVAPIEIDFDPLEIEFVHCRDNVKVHVPWGVVAGGAPGDVTRLGVRNLGGNVSEWVQDRSAGYDDPCWGPDERLLSDPLCLADTHLEATRGGNWSTTPAASDSAYRAAQTDPKPRGGIRCALDL